MGKRELALIIGFVVTGVLVWQVTAPQAEGPGFSFGRIFGEIRREMHGRPESAEVTTKPAIPVDASTNEIRLTLTNGEITIRGEDRPDVAAELVVTSDGYDEAEAKKLASESMLKVSRFADSVVVGWEFPQPGRQIPKLTLVVPSRLRIQLDGRGSVKVTNVDSVTLARTFGSVRIDTVKNLVKGDSRGGDLTIDGAEAIDLGMMGGQIVLKNVRGDVRMNARGGSIRLEQPKGRVTLTGTDTRVRVDGVAGELRTEIIDGDLELNDVSAPIDVDARETPVTIGFARAAAAKVEVREGSLELVLPKASDSYSLDVRATRGELHVPDALHKKTEGDDTFVTKTGGANAPAIFVRGVATTITIR